MELRIMITGNNRRMARDISEHIQHDRGYRVVECAAAKSRLFEMVPIEMPHVIMICLQDETKDTVRVFDVLEDCVNYGFTTILVVASGLDRKLFMAHTKLERIYFLDRPVSLFVLYDKLREIEENPLSLPL